ncbi:MAG: PAS domain S-box protein [Halapricum sp.]
MPDMDGVTLLERLRDRGEDVPFVIFTGKGREEVAIQALNLGADRYLQKGGDPKAQYGLLADAIQQVVERRSTERALSASERRLAEIVERSPIATFVLDADHEITHWNAACEQLLGVSPEEIVGTPDAGEGIYGTARPALGDLVIEDTSSSALRQWYGEDWSHSDTLEDAYVVENEVENAGKWLRRVAAPLRDDEGNRTGAIQTLIDVTDERERERELEATKETLEAIVEAAPVAIVGLDTDGEVTLWSDGAEDLFGWTAEEAVGTSPPPFVPADERESFEWNLEQLLVGETHSEIALTRETKRGDSVDVSLSTAPVRDGNGSLVGVVGVLVERAGDWSVADSLLGALFEQFPDHVHLYVKDGDARHLKVSDTLYDPDELLGETDYEINDLTPEECSTYQDDLRVLTRGERIVEKEERSIHDDRWLLTSKVPWYEDGDIVGLIGLSRDITERKAYQQRLERLRNRFELALEATGAGVLDWDLDTGDVNLHGRAASLLGIDTDTERLTITDLFDRVHPEDVPQLQSTVDAIDTGRDRFEVEYRIEIDDDWRWIDSQGEVQRDESGAPIRAIGTLRDVTERKERQRARRRHRQRIASLHDVATDLQGCADVTAVCERTVSAATGILSFDQCVVAIERDGRLEHEASTEGISDDEFVPLSVEEGLGGRTYRTGESERVDDVLDHPDALSREQFRSVVSVPVGDHGVFQAASSSPGQFDEDDLELAELLVTHTAAALTRLEREAELKAQTRALERQNDRLDRFASIVSHDLRNPLQVAQTRLELARENVDDDNLETIADMHDRMETILSEVLELARQGDRTTDVEPVDVERLCRESWASVETDLATLDVLDDTELEADRQGLKRVFENLFRNAVEHGSTSPDSQTRRDAVEHGSTSPNSRVPADGTSTSDRAIADGADSGRSLTVRIGTLDDCDGFFVADDGPGIPEDKRERIFESGFSMSSDGTGYGLSIVEEIVDAHGWSISVTDSWAGGARFEISGVDTDES